MTSEKSCFAILNDRLVKKALELDIPILGICRGHQTINEAAGGTLKLSVKDLTTFEHAQSQPRDVCTHSVKIKEDSMLAGILGETRIMVNSLHRQEDGLVEAIESETHTFILGVQFHPETLVRKKPCA